MRVTCMGDGEEIGHGPPNGVHIRHPLRSHDRHPAISRRRVVRAEVTTRQDHMRADRLHGFPSRTPGHARA